MYPHSGANKEDLIDHIKTVAKRTANTLVLRNGINDLTNGINTQEGLQEVVEILLADVPGLHINRVEKELCESEHFLKIFHWLGHLRKGTLDLLRIYRLAFI